MCKNKEVDAILSYDYDTLLFGCPYLLRDIDIVEDYADVITLQNIYDHFGITHLQAIDICILMGTDYNEKILGIGPKTTLSEIRNHGKLENTKFYNKQRLNIHRLRQIYNYPYLKHKMKWFSLEDHEELDMIDDSSYRTLGFIPIGGGGHGCNKLCSLT